MHILNLFIETRITSLLLPVCVHNPLIPLNMVPYKNCADMVKVSDFDNDPNKWHKLTIVRIVPLLIFISEIIIKCKLIIL